ncbi:hypothetical protein BSU04_33275 [Caballeronia sordidicola]|uniref:Uncharacterized protein n=1 Tax=Caballeronia sordidicola TaxID=196367 RepID=A0A226WSM7_CABSO|nr:hypothetical protein BSU04_33275 [Caballeronia sordidicola]
MLEIDICRDARAVGGHDSSPDCWHRVRRRMQTTQRCPYYRKSK